MDGLDLVDVAAIAIVVVSLIALAGVVFWPRDRRDDVMQRVHGDQPRLPR